MKQWLTDITIIHKEIYVHLFFFYFIFIVDTITGVLIPPPLPTFTQTQPQPPLPSAHHRVAVWIYGLSIHMFLANPQRNLCSAFS